MSLPNKGVFLLLKKWPIPKANPFDLPSKYQTVQYCVRIYWNGKYTRTNLFWLIATSHYRADIDPRRTCVRYRETSWRNWRTEYLVLQKLVAAADFVEASLTDRDYKINRQNFSVECKTCSNIEVEISGTEGAKEIVVIGAHYDTVFDSPGADDNGSGVAAILALARRFAGQRPVRTLRFVLFANEEPPFFQTKDMGSLIYAKSCKIKNDNIVSMLCLESIGYYSEQPNSQEYPFPYNHMYPSTGNFIGFVSNLSSRKLLNKVIASFRQNCKFPSQGGVAPGLVPGVAWSDHWSFWQQGYPAVMITDTAPFRYPYYHGSEDKADRICYDHLTRVVSGLQITTAELIGLVTRG